MKEVTTCTKIKYKMKLSDSLCFLCFAMNKRTFNIINTHLQSIYEKITDFKIINDTHYLCYICHTRLQQCYKLCQLAEQTQNILKSFHDKQKKNKLKPQQSLVELCTEEVVNLSIACNGIKTSENQEPEKEEEYYQNGWCSGPIEQLELIPDLSSYFFEPERDYRKDLENTDDFDVKEDSSVKYSSDSDIPLHKFIKRHDFKKKLISVTMEKTIMYKDIEQESFIGNKENTLKNNLLAQTRISDPKLFICRFCPFISKQIASLLIHENTHGGKKKKHNAALKRNFFFNHHSNVRKKVQISDEVYSCDICSRTFNFKSNLKVHKRIHTGDKPYGCDTCERRFSDKSSLNRHNRIHTGEKPYKCTMCKSEFSHSSSLKRHKIKSH